MYYFKRLLVTGLILSFLVSIPLTSYSISEKGYQKLHTFAEILHQIEENYVEDIDEDVVIAGAIKGMLRSLDPHTVYMTPEVYKELKVESTGRFGGIGIEVTMKKGWLTVVAPIAESPAIKAGIKANDRIVRVNGVSTKGITLSEAVGMMRGRVGTSLNLTVIRNNSKKPINFTVPRKVINIPSVTVEDLGDGYIYAKVNTFQQRSAIELKKKINKIARGSAIKGLILDVRNNPGGLLSQAIDISDLFIKKGMIVSTRSRNKEIAKYVANEEGTLPDVPIVVLVNGGSASASEILAGALKDNKRAALIGTQTFGKGSVQSVFELDDGSAVKITIAKYYTPSGVSIQGLGINPNIIIEEGEDENAPDIQKAVAIEYLKDDSKYKRALRSSGKKYK